MSLTGGPFSYNRFEEYEESLQEVMTPEKKAKLGKKVKEKIEDREKKTKPCNWCI